MTNWKVRRGRRRGTGPARTTHTGALMHNLAATG